VKIVIDMNLAPVWVQVFQREGWECQHWSQIGDPRATDGEIMAWARTNGFIVFTHDLDFSALLAATQAQGPSVLQVRAQNVLPDHLGEIVVRTLRQFDSILADGALISVDEARARVRVLPLMR
jgi:predicted nuclease of predicted toxin-antitoxin system